MGTTIEPEERVRRYDDTNLPTGYGAGEPTSTGPRPLSRVRARPRGQGLAKSLGMFSLGLGLIESVAPGAVASFLGIPPKNRLIRGFGAREIASGIGILSRRRPAGWMWARVGGDVMDLASLGAAVPASKNRGRVAVSAALVGGILALDVLCARQLSRGRAAGQSSPSTT